MVSLHNEKAEGTGRIALHSQPWCAASNGDFKSAKADFKIKSNKDHFVLSYVLASLISICSKLAENLMKNEKRK